MHSTNFLTPHRLVGRQDCGRSCWQDRLESPDAVGQLQPHQ